MEPIEREWESVCVNKKIFFKKSAHIIVEAQEVQNLVVDTARLRLKKELQFEPNGSLL